MRYLAAILCILLLPATAMAAAGVLVYDNNGDFLGVFAGHSGNSAINVYNPTLGVNLNIYTSTGGDVEGHISSYQLYYSGGSCSGTVYIKDNAFYNTLVKNGSGPYTFWYSRAVAGNTVSYGSTKGTDGTCNASDSGTDKLRQATEYTNTLPFTYPIEFPLQYRYRGGAVVIPLN